jgi:hypothetical protein
MITKTGRCEGARAWLVGQGESLGSQGVLVPRASRDWTPERMPVNALTADTPSCCISRRDAS